MRKHMSTTFDSEFRRRKMGCGKLVVTVILALTWALAAAEDADSMQEAVAGLSDQVSSSSTDNNIKVNLSVYYEALCPYCANFMVNHLLKIFQTDLINIVNLRLVPWGNTQIQSNDTWICQHGIDECRLDVIEACAINAWPRLETHFKFIYCVERLHLMDRHTEWRSCYGANNLDQTPLNNCYNNGLGFQLEKAYADETAKLNPRHRFVPWVVVNNIPLQEDFQNFIGYVCRAYKGNKVPNACTG